MKKDQSLYPRSYALPIQRLEEGSRLAVESYLVVSHLNTVADSCGVCIKGLRGMIDDDDANQLAPTILAWYKNNRHAKKAYRTTQKPQISFKQKSLHSYTCTHEHGYS